MADNNNGAFIWSIANLLRGVYKQADYGKVVLPFTILRRLDAVLEPTKDAVLAEYEKRKDGSIPVEKLLPSISQHDFYNTSLYTVDKLGGDPANVRANLLNYIDGFSANVRDIFDRYDFPAQIARLDENDLLYLVVQK
ncbi:type I restriction-modification system subunit M N-terminal domain-containing protein [Cryobacterium sp. Y29]|uniref:type I restriction-modification system subunit M N-terminal domain-containing protein n=1 Tax=Cryobacterium sp. Y29 TaxID=2048285 RepID=UPI000CE37601|nr:type I restriction-modification system subunit M N-terminal domain-containing protein [Cryobacterium sp. Y29]